MIVTVNGAAPVHGHFFSSDESRLSVLNVNQAVEDYERSDITEIKIAPPYSAGRDALKGFLIGSAAYGLTSVRNDAVPRAPESANRC